MFPVKPYSTFVPEDVSVLLGSYDLLYLLPNITMVKVGNIMLVRAVTTTGRQKLSPQASKGRV